MSAKRKPVHRDYARSYYTLVEVLSLIDKGRVLITPNAQRDANQLFGWKRRDIIDVYRKLMPAHFYKTDGSKQKPGVALDFYKATIMGENIYTHFYIDDDEKMLIINSFHSQQ